MNKSLFSLLILTLVVLVIAGTSQGFQGRMAGMGDPYGLISDESDFLIHPAKIATGDGVRFYGGYRFTYKGVTDWGYDLDRFTLAGILTEYYHFDTSGQEYAHDALVGAAFPLGPGRMGLFFTYDGMRGDYDGDEFSWNGTTYFYPEYDLTSDLDDFALRLLYGIPVGGFNLGGEVQIAYRQGKNEGWIYDPTIGAGLLNSHAVTWIPWANLFPFVLPYDSTYWEILFKGSMEGNVGPLDIEFTPRG
jgi:hypothetical protein